MREQFDFMDGDARVVVTIEVTRRPRLCWHDRRDTPQVSELQGLIRDLFNAKPKARVV
jgi:hypothetical protein